MLGKLQVPSMHAGVFSMDGHIAPLAEICALARKHNALVFVDECHATGFVGATGRGTDEHCGVAGQVDIINSTLGKAMGGATDMPLRCLCLFRLCYGKRTIDCACKLPSRASTLMTRSEWHASAAMLMVLFGKRLLCTVPGLCAVHVVQPHGRNIRQSAARSCAVMVWLCACARGYTTGRKEVVEMLRQKARPYLFSNTLAPPVAAASIEAFNMLEESSGLRDTLEDNTKYFRAAMTEARGCLIFLHEVCSSAEM